MLQKAPWRNVIFSSQTSFSFEIELSWLHKLIVNGCFILMSAIWSWGGASIIHKITTYSCKLECQLWMTQKSSTQYFCCQLCWFLTLKRWNVTWKASLMSFILQVSVIMFTVKLSKQSSTSILQPDNQLHVSALVLSTYLFFLFWSRSQLWKGLERMLMPFCLSAVYLSYLFSEVLLSPSYAVTD